MVVKKFAVFLLFLFLQYGFVCAAGSAVGKNANIEQNSDVRHIKVCILDDENFPVSRSIIAEVLDNVFNDYREKLGIDFEYDKNKIFSYPGYYEISPGKFSVVPPQFNNVVKQNLFWLGYARNIVDFCGDDSEVRIIFTDSSDYLPGKPVWDRYDRGEALSFGYVLIYQANYSYSEKDAAGNNILEYVVKHEIAHLFGANHVDDKNSVMYPTPEKSTGGWDAKTVDIINKNKYKKWYPQNQE